jgi:hypothetical protein
MKHNFPLSRKMTKALLLWCLLIHLTNFTAAQPPSNCQPGTENNNLPGSCPSAKIDAGIMIDQAFVNQYSDLNAAREAATNIFNSMASNLSSLLAQAGYAVNFKIVHFPTEIVPNSWNATSNPSTGISNIRNIWLIPARYCIKQDGIILLSGQNLPYNGVQNNSFFCEPGTFANAQVTIIRNKINDPVGTGKSMAHEMMHNFGLDHINNFNNPTSCAQECNSSFIPLMCTTAGGYSFSTCDLKCINRFFDQTKCECLKTESQYRAPDYVCPVSSNISFDFSNDNPNPIRNCFSGKDEMTIMVKLKNNDQATSRNIRLRLNDDSKNYLELIQLSTSCVDQNGRTICFNSESLIPNGGKEFKILKMDGSEQFFDLMANAEINVTIKVRYIRADIPNFPLNYKFFIRAYSGTIGSPGTTDFFIQPFVEVDATPSKNFSAIYNSGLWPTSLPIFIKGNLVLDNVTSLPAYELSQHKNILFAPGSGIDIANTKTLVNQVSMSGCNQMWEGVEIRSGSELIVDQSTISDAQFGLYFRTTSKGTVTGTVFNRNNYGIFTEPMSTQGGGIPINLIANGNNFKCSETPLKPPYNGQSPIPTEKGYVGLYLNDIPSMAIQKDQNGCYNVFNNLTMGIIGVNSNFSVNDALFSDITYPLNAYQGYPTDQNGSAVYANNSLVKVTGMGYTTTSPQNFKNCDYGVQAINSTLHVQNNNMHNVRTGVDMFGGVNKSVSILENRIDATYIGIGLYYNSLLNTNHGVSNNVITMSGLDYATGILVSGGKGHQTNINNIRENFITMNNGSAGIRVEGAAKNNLVNNTINLTNPGNNRFGITLNGSQNLSSSCNNIIGANAANATGIRTNSTFQSTIGCNNISGTATALNFSGDCSLSTVRGNTVQNASIGMLYGLNNGVSSVLVGTQAHRGNIWDNGTLGVGAKYNGNFNSLNQNFYFVDLNQDLRFLPSIINSPQDWFNLQASNSSYRCQIGGADCPFPVVAGDVTKENDKDRIATGNIYASNFESTLKAQAQKHFYTYLAETGLPSGSSSNIQQFFNNTTSATYKSFGDMDLAIRNIFRIGGLNDSILSNYESLLGSKLTQLSDVDRQLTRPDLLSGQQSTLSAQRDSTLQAAQVIKSNWFNLTKSLDQARQNGLTALLSQNNSLSDASTWNTNEKAVNGIFLNTMGIGVYRFTTSQLSSLQSVAAQCPLSGGESVYWARTMLEGVLGITTLYDDEALCLQSIDRQDMEQHGDQLVRIYPNPNSGSFTLYYQLEQNQSTPFLLYNALGQDVHHSLLPGTTGNIAMQLDHLAPGIYFYVVPGVSAPISGRLMIANK